MKNVVTFETAKRLKEAGFPQPEPEVGQYWYSINAECLLWLQWKDEYSAYFSAVGDGQSSWAWDYEKLGRLVFAPTATDILERVPGWCIAIGGNGFWWCFKETEPNKAFAGNNPAENAAAAWMELYEKKQTTMKNVVTFETALRLKEAGFPQPNFATGQFWYNDLGALSFVGRKELNETGKHDYFYCTSVESGRTDFFQPIANDAFFAPTAIEILQELEYADLTFRDGKFRVVSEHVMNRHDNPAEASALAWLELHEKKDLQK